jgi:hypothetical protein
MKAFALVFLGLAASGVPALAQTDRSKLPDNTVQSDAPKPKPAVKPAVQQQRPQVRPSRPERPQVVPPRPQPQPERPQVLPPGPERPVRPPPNWEGQHWRHGTWQPANHGWYDWWYGFGRVVLYADPHYRGRGLFLRQSEPNLRRWNFNNRAQSIRVSGRWQICSKTYFRGDCRVVRSSRRQLYGIGMDRRISSIRFLGY